MRRFATQLVLGLVASTCVIAALAGEVSVHLFKHGFETQLLFPENQQLTFAEDAPAQTITLTATGGSPLTFSIGVTPALGVLSAVTPINGTSASVLYTPAANANGADSFTFTVHDAANNSQWATVDISLTAVNDAPINSVPGNQSIGVGAGLNFNTANGNAISGSDVDAASGNVTTTVSTTLGSFIAVPVNGSTTVTGSGTPSVQITGSLSDVNATLQSLNYSSGSSGIAQVTVLTSDNGNTGSGGAQSDSDGFQIDVDSAPSVTTTVPGNGASNVVLASDITINFNEAVTFSDGSFTLSCNGAVPFVSSGSGTATATLNPTGDLPGGASCTVTVVGSGISDVDSIDPPNTMAANHVFTFTTFNNPPIGTDNTISMNEDTQRLLTSADFGTFFDPDGNPFVAVRIAALGVGGVLEYDTTGSGAWVDVTQNQEITTAHMAANRLRFVPGSNQNGSAYRTISFQVGDGISFDASPNVLTIDVIAVNDPPTSTNDSVTTNEDTTVLLATSDFGTYADVESSPLASVRISTLETDGDLEFDTTGGGVWADVTLNQDVTAAHIAANRLRFVPDPNENGTPYATMGFRVNDGTVVSTAAYTLTITVAAVNDLPTSTNDSVGTNEDTTLTLSGNNFGTFSDVDGQPFASVRITTLESAGDLEYDTTGGGVWVDVTLNQDVTMADIGANRLRFIPAANANGTPYATIGFSVSDGTVSSAASYTLTINVAAINDPPTSTNDSMTFNEDITTLLATSDFGTYADVELSPLASVRISTLESNGDFEFDTTGGGVWADVTLNQVITAANITANRLRFVPDLNENGTPYTTIGFEVNDGTAFSAVSYVLTINVSAVNDAPVAGADGFDFIGNTELRVDLAAVATPHALEVTSGTNGVINNDNDPVEGNAIAVTSLTVGICTDNSAPFSCTDPTIGTVNLVATGDFNFVPVPGDTDPTSAFTYQITDNGTPSPASATGTVVLTRFARVWYVSAAAAAGNGTSASPMNGLTALNGAGGAGDSDSAGDYLFVHNNGTLAGGLELEANQHLLGEGVGLSIPVALNGNSSPTNLVTAGTRPPWTNSGGNAISIGCVMPIEIRGLSLASTSGNAIDLTCAAPRSGSLALTISDNNFRGASAEGVDINLDAGSSNSLALAFNNNTWLTGTHTGNAFDLLNANTVTLGLAFNNNVGIFSSATAVLINDTNAAGITTITGFANNTIARFSEGAGIVVNNVTFDAIAGVPIDVVSGGNTKVGVFGNGIAASGVSLTNVTGDLSFTDLDVYNQSGTGLNVTSTGALNAAAGTGFRIAVSVPGVATIDNTGGCALSINNASANLPLDHLGSFNSLGTGVSLVNTFGGVGSTTLSASSGFIGDPNSASGTAVNISGGDGNIALGMPIVNKSGNAIAIEDKTSGSVSFSQYIDETGLGIRLINNSGAAIGFSGGLIASTGNNPAFLATGGGTVAISGAVMNTLTTTTGTALTIADTTIGVGGINFRSINSNGGTNAIVLNNTGTIAGLTVIGNGSAGTGGTISNTSGSGVLASSTQNLSLHFMNLINANINDGGDVGECDLATVVDCNGAIDLTSVTGVALNSMTIDGGAENGIVGSSVNGLTMSNVTVQNVGDDAAENGAYFIGLHGTVNIANSVFTGNFANNFAILNDAAGPAALSMTVTGSTFSSNGTFGEDGFLYDGRAGTNATLTLTGNTFTANRGDHFQVALSGNAIANATFGTQASPNTLSGGHGTALGQGITTRVGGNFSGALTFDINGNTLNGAISTGINTGSGSMSGGTINGKIRNNTVGTTGVALSGSTQGDCILAETNGTGSPGVYNVLISGNVIKRCFDRGIYVLAARDTAASPLNATITNNNVAELVNAASRNAIFFETGSSGATETATVCADVANNTLAAVTAVDEVRIRQRSNVQIRMPGYTGGIVSDANVKAYIEGRNAAGGTALVDHTFASAFANTPGPGNPCPQPP